MARVPDHIAYLRTDPRVKDINMRLRWDMAHYAKLTPWFVDHVYKYANDDHIDTALRTAMTELGVPQYRKDGKNPRTRKNGGSNFPRWDVLGRRFYDGTEAIWFAKQKALDTGKKVPVRQQDDGYSPSFELQVIDPKNVKPAYDLKKNPRLTTGRGTRWIDAKHVQKYPVKRYDFEWNKDYSKFRAHKRAHWSEDSYKKWQGDWNDENDNANPHRRRSRRNAMPSARKVARKLHRQGHSRLASIIRKLKLRKNRRR